MATQEYRIVPGEASDVHDEPHIEESRVTVRLVRELVEDADLAPGAVARRYDLDIADVYGALAYYHANPAEMRRVDRRHEEAVDQARAESSLVP
jgi:uncharacterized protein (DUF433 family)